MLRFIRITFLPLASRSKQNCRIPSPLSPHIIIVDQAPNLIVEFITHKAEHKVLSVNSMICSLQTELLPRVYLTDCSFGFEIECH